MITYKKNNIDERVRKWNDYRRLRYNKIPEETNSIYMIFREIGAGKVPSTLYVGKSKQDIQKRLIQHVSEVNRAIDGKIEWSLKLRWMYQVLKEGDNLKSVLLNNVPISKVYEIETEWITYLGLAGFKLVNGGNNSVYYSK
jgi:hypothetical protein